LAPLISVIIPTYNRAGLILRAVNSALAQIEANFEVIVVNDGSKDETEELLKPLVRSGKIQLLYQENQGVAAARNAGVALAKGQLIAFLDSDDEWLPIKLAAQIKDLAEKPRYPVSQCQEIWIRGDRRVNPGLKHKKKEGDIFLDSVKRCLISPSAVIFKAGIFKEIGLFDESFLACEDYDLWLRLTARYEVGLLDKALVVRHGGRSDQLSAGFGLDFYRVRALEKILAEGGLSQERAAAAALELTRRRKIFENGRKKRESAKIITSQA
jgi:glycosyltransferase involved in cell wall biosynthesis